MRFVMMFLVFLIAQQVYSQQLPLYYGNEFLNSYQTNTLHNDDLKNSLFTILSGGHIKNENSGDTLVPSCGTSSDNAAEAPVTPAVPKCVEHHPLGYDGARTKLFGLLFLKTLDTGIFSVKDVYCEKTFTDADFGGAPTFGPNLLPSSGNLINTEHTWPQSRFTGRFPRDTQKSDLHHLFPTDSEINAHRGSLRFGNVVENIEALKCPQSRLGHQVSGEIIFEVPDAQKGNTARAIFYFATRYQMKISPSEEQALRAWNKADPVDAAEYERNNQIELLQGNRNPYVDFADMLDHIDHF